MKYYKNRISLKYKAFSYLHYMDLVEFFEKEEILEGGRVDVNLFGYYQKITIVNTYIQELANFCTSYAYFFLW